MTQFTYSSFVHCSHRTPNPFLSWFFLLGQIVIINEQIIVCAVKMKIRVVAEKFSIQLRKKLLWSWFIYFCVLKEMFDSVLPCIIDILKTLYISYL